MESAVGSNASRKIDRAAWRDVTLDAVMGRKQALLLPFPDENETFPERRRYAERQFAVSRTADF